MSDGIRPPIGDRSTNSLSPEPWFLSPVSYKQPRHPLVPTEARDLASPDLASTSTRQWMTER